MVGHSFGFLVKLLISEFGVQEKLVSALGCKVTKAFLRGDTGALG